MPGNGAHLKFLSMSGLLAAIEAYTNGQLISAAAALPPSTARRAWSSWVLASDGSAAGEVAKAFMTSRALSAGGPSETDVPSSLRIWPPAEVTRLLNQTTRPSYWAPVTSLMSWSCSRDLAPGQRRCAGGAGL